jgi:hypothetical protein
MSAAWACENKSRGAQATQGSALFCGEREILASYS